MKIGNYSFFQRSNGDYLIVFADSSNEYNQIKVLVPHQQLVAAVEEAINETVQHYRHCANLFLTAMTTEDTISEELSKVLAHLPDQPTPSSRNFRNNTDKIDYLLECWLVGFNKVYGSHLTKEQIKPYLKRYSLP